MGWFKSNPSFLGIYENALTSDECDLLIDKFNKSKLIPGTIYRGAETGVDSNVKSSIELDGPHFTDKSLISNVIDIRLRECTTKYAAQYPAPSFIPTDSSQVVIDDDYTFKKFEGRDGGYKQWHCEHGIGTSRRVLVWMFYLNNASGTDFLYYPTVRAKKGRCLIWPAGFTHTHKSSPNKGIKYIISGWISIR